MLFIEYLKLTSPRIALLVMLAGFTGIWAGSRGTAEPAVVFWTLLGIGLASSGASVFNNYYDRDIDRLMQRTSERPLPSGRLKPAGVLIFGISLSAAAFGILLISVNLLTSLITLLAVFIYSFLYTVILKRRTPLATEVGGISGALSPVIGWAAAAGSVSYETLLLFAMMFYWQPAHFWALALEHKGEYKRAGIPTLAVVRSAMNTKCRSFIYILALVIAGFMPYLSGMTGRLHLVISIVLGGLYISLGLIWMFSANNFNKKLFIFSLIYISLIFISIILDIQ